MNMADFVIFDLETTGFNTESCKIIEFGGILIKNGEVVRDCSILINPLCCVPPKISQLTGITTSMVMQEPTIYDVYDDIVNFIGQNTLVGYNIDNFDMKFLNNIALEIDGQCLKNKTMDILPIMRSKYPSERYSLEAMADRIGYEYKAHRALNDCYAVYNIMKVYGLLN